ncbi:MAG: hypothetical protein IJ780_05815 [Neisseriaceae bacterium]|nr:hypothetical protein [Neisseriaceae bacterium]MBR1819625.1 hypothetical protein [Neisseriaceae bacterium]
MIKKQRPALVGRFFRQPERCSAEYVGRFDRKSFRLPETFYITLDLC